MAENERTSLTGTWNGLYFYPGDGSPVSFVAVLDDAGDRFTGTIDENDTRSRAGPCRAIVDGRRAGNTVYFTKTYDGRGAYAHSVAYEGVVDADVTEIHGGWSLPGLSGTFLMMRPGAAAQSVTRESEESVG